MLQGDRLGIRLFGGFEVRVAGEPIGRVRSRSVEWLLALLALRHGREVPRSFLAGLLWPESAQEHALPNLRRNLMDLRRALGPAAERLRSPTRDSLLLEIAGAEVDVVAFDQAIAAGDDASLAGAVSLYRGPLLEGWAEEWVLPERERRAEACLQALEALAGRAAQRGERSEAEAYLRQAAGFDPLRDATQRRLMELLADGGDTPAAIQIYREYRLRLREELGVEPDPETTRRFQELRGGVRSEKDRRTLLRRQQSPASSSQSPLLRTAPLPRPLTALIGREEAVGEVLQALDASRLVTLAGEGGVGKTRLALQVAEELLDLFDEAVAFVELAPLADPSLVLSSVAEALGIREGEGTPDPGSRLRSVMARLGASPALLVLDNCEHVIEAVAQLAATLLAGCPELRVLATSRQRLALTGEVVWWVPPLPSPDPDTLPADDGSAKAYVLGYPAGQLFVQRAAAVRPGFHLGGREEALAVAAICRRLDGLPLALELAAARIALLSPREMLGRLERWFDFLVSRQRDTPARHRTLLAVIDSSYQLLSPELQRFFARLSVFRGGWTLEAAEAVGSEPEALEYLEQLRDCSLLTVEEEGRYRLLETLREYAWEQLTVSGERDQILRRHWDWYLHLAERERPLADLQDREQWLLRQERERDNFRAALRASHEAVDRLGDRAAAEAGLRLASSLAQFWIWSGYLAEGLDALETALADGGDLPATVRAPALNGAAHIASARGDRSRAPEFREQSRRAYERILQAARAAGNRQEIAATLSRLVDNCFWLDDLDATWDYGLEARQLAAELVEPSGHTRVLEMMAGISLRRGDLQTARALMEERLALCRKLGAAPLLVHALGGMGHLERQDGNYARARAYYQESLVLRRELGDKFALAQSLEDLAVLAGRQGQVQRALRLLGAGEAFCETLGARPPVSSDEEYERTVAAGRAALGEAAFAAAWAEGRALSLEEAIEKELPQA